MNVCQKPNKRSIVIYYILDYYLMGDKILLDSEVFKALASQSRLEILKNLDERRKTVTELSRTMELNKATVYEHLSVLNSAGLVSKIESSNKWVYYALTWKGVDLLHPEKKKIAIVLSVAITFLVVGMIQMITYMRQVAHNYAAFENTLYQTREYSQKFAMLQGGDMSNLLLGVVLFALFCLTLIAGIWLWKTAPSSPVMKAIE